MHHLRVHGCFGRWQLLAAVDAPKLTRREVRLHPRRRLQSRLERMVHGLWRGSASLQHRLKVHTLIFTLILSKPHSMANDILAAR